MLAEEALKALALRTPSVGASIRDLANELAWACPGHKADIVAVTNAVDDLAGLGLVIAGGTGGGVGGGESGRWGHSHDGWRITAEGRAFAEAGTPIPGGLRGPEGLKALSIAKSTDGSGGVVGPLGEAGQEALDEDDNVAM